MAEGTDEPVDDVATRAEILDEEFQNSLRVAKSLKTILLWPKDKEIFNLVVKRCVKFIESTNIDVKINTVTFIRYYLTILDWTCRHQPTETYTKWMNSCNFIPKSETKTWLVENVAYLSTKTLPDGTVLVYLAISNDPEKGWQVEGLEAFKKNAEGRFKREAE